MVNDNSIAYFTQLLFTPKALVIDWPLRNKAFCEEMANNIHSRRRDRRTLEEVIENTMTGKAVEYALENYPGFVVTEPEGNKIDTRDQDSFAVDAVHRDTGYKFQCKTQQGRTFRLFQGTYEKLLRIVPHLDYVVTASSIKKEEGVYQVLFKHLINAKTLEHHMQPADDGKAHWFKFKQAFAANPKEAEYLSFFRI